MRILYFRRSSLGIGLLVSLTWSAAPSLMAQEDVRPSDVSRQTYREWIEVGEQEDFDWNVSIDNPELTIDQRFEISVKARVDAGDLETSAGDHRLHFVVVVADSEGTVLATSEPVLETLPAQAHEDARVEFESYISLIPGRYTVWAILYDEATDQRNVSRDRKEVDPIRNDPLPDAYANFPRVEFARVAHSGPLSIRLVDSDLSIPIERPRPLEVELIATVSAPEQWPDGGAITRHIENLLGALRALAELDPDQGAVSITGLDLLRRRIAFSQAAGEPVDWKSVMDTFEEVNRSAVSVDALLGRKENPAFLKDYIQEEARSHIIDPRKPPGPADPLKVMILVAGVMRFERDADLSPVVLEGDCDCRLYHIRFKQELGDLFDQVDDILKPLDPPTFDVLSARDFRKVIGEIVADLGSSGL